jgi:hypothetical protein
MKYFWTCLLFFCFACKKNNETFIGENSNKVIIEGSKKIISIEIDSSTSPYYFESQYLPKENSLVIANTNKDEESLLLLNLDKNQINKKTIYKSEGENDIQQSHRNFYYHNKDSIFLVGLNDHKFYLTDENGFVKSKLDLDGLTGDVKELGQPFLFMGTSSAFYKKGIFTFVTFPINTRDMLQSSEDPIFVNLDLKSEVLTQGNIKYSFSVEDDVFQHPEYINPLLTSNSEQIIILFKLSNKIISYRNNKIDQIKTFKSNYFDDYIKMDNYNNIFSFFIESNANYKLLFNQKSNNYFLFVSHKTPFKDDNGNKNNFYSKPFSLIIFNNEFEKIEELRFDGNNYNISASFISNDNLYLSLNNPKNEVFDENYFKYEVYEFQDN